ncbi:MAG: cysteine--tRNA ligase [Alphaproteobacteria bacterium]|nr:cysteine--tRNA ligase [Alphaproteobacteria bacterium]
MNIKFFNSASKAIEEFKPANATISMYVCGPTVYDRPHIGNARSIVVYDILYRLLIEKYGKDKVKYVRNITDVDDKINASAKEKNTTIKALTENVLQSFYSDIEKLNCLPPNIEPKATEHMKEIIDMISTLIEKKKAYTADNHVYFNVSSFSDYGKLARKDIKELEAGHRVEVNSAKKSPEDFVLWKPAKNEDDPSSIFQSPWGDGRPGWHIECSAMSTKYLGQNFDIHGGGVDLIFPHHTNEIAQSCSCYEESSYAKHWIHNGFLTVEGEKMSKSLGNFFTIKDLLEKGIKGETIRYVYLSTHYRKPLNWTEKSIEDAKKSLDSFYRILSNHINLSPSNVLDSRILAAINNDMNIPAALSVMHDIVKEYNKADTEKEDIAKKLLNAGRILGLFYSDPKTWFHVKHDENIESLIEKRKQAKLNKNWAEADKIRVILQEKGIILEDKPDGTTTWRQK